MMVGSRLRFLEVEIVAKPNDVRKEALILSVRPFSKLEDELEGALEIGWALLTFPAQINSSSISRVPRIRPCRNFLSTL